MSACSIVFPTKNDKNKRPSSNFLILMIRYASQRPHPNFVTTAGIHFSHCKVHDETTDQHVPHCVLISIVCASAFAPAPATPMVALSAAMKTFSKKIMSFEEWEYCLPVPLQLLLYSLDIKGRLEEEKPNV